MKLSPLLCFALDASDEGAAAAAADGAATVAAAGPGPVHPAHGAGAGPDSLDPSTLAAAAQVSGLPGESST